jgi:hypothetical protein
MSLAIGILMALGVGVMATFLRLDRDRAMYPVVMIVIAFLYVLFAVIGGGGQVLVIELGVAMVFVALALAGFRSSLWLVVVALAGHGLFDAVHPRLYVNPGVPPWWPSFCAAYDVVAAAYLAWLLASRRLR